MAIKEKRIKCVACGQRETVIRGERGPAPSYCDACREESKREQARLRMRALRAKRRFDAPKGAEAKKRLDGQWDQS